jgi:transcriptional regulator with GAF, ATPase, and Fis domain
MRIFAARAGAELERKRAEQALREAMAEVERLKNRLQEENVYLQEEIKTQHNFEEIIGASAAIQRVFHNIEKVADTDATVLITGETGTGKELVARALHNLSRRKASALIKVNCAALPGGLIESELFGHEKGAFTGAIARKKGRFELADGGTIFLDEVGELPLETQAKLLRVLQEQEFERVGGSGSLRVDVRVIAATNRDLGELVKLGAFRADLFYRLNIFPIALPALRERGDDVPLLTNYFVSAFSRRMGKKIDRVAREAMDRLTGYHWPGNVRELANVLERAVILCDGGALQPDHIGISDSIGAMDAVVSTLEEAERDHILKALEQTRWVVGGPTGAAKLLGLNRTTLLARMKKLGIERAGLE